jgi:nucleoside-diphosphate-sugar epimerase
VTATAVLLDHAVRAGAASFTLASTATVYRPSPRPLAEDAPTDPHGIYAARKRSAELLCEPYAALLGCRALRVFTVYGAERDERLVADLVDRVASGRPVEVRGERGLVTSPIHAPDVARAVIAAIGRPPARGALDVVNVGGAEALSLEDMAQAIGAALGREPAFDRRPGTDVGIVADRTRCRAVLGVPEPARFADAIAAELGAAVEPA